MKNRSNRLKLIKNLKILEITVKENKVAAQDLAQETTRIDGPDRMTVNISDPSQETAITDDPSQETANTDDPIQETANTDDPIQETANTEGLDLIREIAKTDDLAPIQEIESTVKDRTKENGVKMKETEITEIDHLRKIMRKFKAAKFILAR